MPVPVLAHDSWKILLDQGTNISPNAFSHWIQIITCAYIRYKHTPVLISGTSTCVYLRGNRVSMENRGKIGWCYWPRDFTPPVMFTLYVKRADIFDRTLLKEWFLIWLSLATNCCWVIFTVFYWRGSLLNNNQDFFFRSNVSIFDLKIPSLRLQIKNLMY